MERIKILPIIKKISAEFGYRANGVVYWKQFNDLCKIIALQSSRYGGGKYINLGLQPMSFISGKYPTSKDGMSVIIRGSELLTAHKPVLDQLELDHDNQMNIHELPNAIRSVFEWVDTAWQDVEEVRQRILARTEWYDSHVFMPLRDWARGELKEPKHYYE